MKSLIKRLFSLFGCEIRRKGAGDTFFNRDPLFNSLYERAQIATQMQSTDNMLRRQRHYTLNQLLRNVDLKSGFVCEIGCWRGLSAYQIASYLKGKSEKTEFHIFDSFEGLSEIESVDRCEEDRRDVESLRKQFACSLQEVQDNLKEFDFVTYHKGWIPEKFREVEDKTFSFVHVDVDLHQPIKDSMEFFYPRLASKGVMVFDDYGCIQFPGAKRAIDEYLTGCINAFFLPLPSGQAFLVKDFGDPSHR